MAVLCEFIQDDSLFVTYHVIYCACVEDGRGHYLDREKQVATEQMLRKTVRQASDF